MTAIELFLSPGDQGGQTLQKGLDESSLAETGAGKDSKAGVHHIEPGGDPNSLPDQGWGVIAAKNDDGERLLELVKPLLDQRAEDQGREVRIDRVKPGMDAAQSASWVDRKFHGNQALEDIPLYVLVLGGPDAVSLKLQKILSTRHYIGRLAFDADAQYEAYVAKLLASERGPQSPELARSLFFTALDGTPATTLGHEALMQPSIGDAEEDRDKREDGYRRRFPVSEIVPIAGAGADAGDQLLAAAASDHPSILFSCSHGMGAPQAGWESTDHQRALQGAMCLGQGKHIAGDNLTEAAFLPGGLWFLFACFGAGTPSHSEYYHWLSRLKEHGEFGGDLDVVLASLPDEDEAFIASLPRAALANPKGPLAVMGHLDLAWSYSFQDIEKFRGKERHRRFQGLLHEMARGSRVGLALGGTLHKARDAVKTEITVAADAAVKAEVAGEEASDDDARLGHRWMLHQDLDGYVLLGDPAARLAIDPAAVKAARKRQRQAKKEATPSIATTPPEPQAPAERPSGIPEGMTVDKMEEIVHEMIRGQKGTKAIAKDHGIADRKILGAWKDQYTEAGRAALARLFGE